MTRDEAARLVKAFFEGQGAIGPDLHERDAGGAMIGSAELFFEYQPEPQTLVCRALIYRFRGEPKAQVVDALKREEMMKAAETGGGALEYDALNRGLYLSRTYQASIAPEEFDEEMQQLIAASLVWGSEVLDRVASQVFHPEEIR